MFKNEQLGPKANGKPNTNKDYYAQGWEAARAGYELDECPYYATSTAEKHWKLGHQSD